jgi:hypothetical protein
VFGNRCRWQELLAATFTIVLLGLTQHQSPASEWCEAETPSIIVAMFVRPSIFDALLLWIMMLVINFNVFALPQGYD